MTESQLAMKAILDKWTACTLSIEDAEPLLAEWTKKYMTITLRRVPVSEVSSITYTDTDGKSQSWVRPIEPITVSEIVKSHSDMAIDVANDEIQARLEDARTAVERDGDWTVGGEGLSNTSQAYNFLVQEVRQLIVESASSVLAGRVEMVAKLIVSQLAHRYGMRPPELISGRAAMHAWTEREQFRAEEAMEGRDGAIRNPE